MNLRRATPDDALALAAVHVAAWQAAYRGIVPDSYLETFTIQSRSERFRQFLAGDSAETYAAERDGEIVGFLTIGSCRDSDLNPANTGEIWGIYLVPKHWREGIGRYLCEQGERMLASYGYSTVALWVLAANSRARGFYEAMGFKIDGACKDVQLGVTLKAVRYRISLSTI
ncbi:MAG: GNAT family N-acetyltransferase [Spirochaetaceae bacterium]|nr:MAG: GNAT family N-acetyltransferase [Spirochaetaceae bacterium]